MMMNLIPSREDVWFPLQRELDKLFDTMFDSKRLPSLLNSVKAHSGYPKLDVLVTDGRYRVEVAVPGVNSEDLKVEILPGSEGERCLRISGRMSKDYLYSNDTTYHYRELTRSKFQRVVSIPSEIQGDPEAIVQNGMLTLTWELPPPTQRGKDQQVKEVTIKTA